MQDDFEDFLVSGELEDSLKDHVTEEPTGAPLAMWETEIQDIELEKGESGLGFSILDYQVRKLEDLPKFRSPHEKARISISISQVKHKAVTHEFGIEL